MVPSPAVARVRLAAQNSRETRPHPHTTRYTQSPLSRHLHCLSRRWSPPEHGFLPSTKRLRHQSLLGSTRRRCRQTIASALVAGASDWSACRAGPSRGRYRSSFLASERAVLPVGQVARLAHAHAGTRVGHGSRNSIAIGGS